jgi:hypothetical protein
MNRIKVILYGLGIGLIIAGFLIALYEEIGLSTPYNCNVSGCNFSPEWIYQNITIPQIIAYSGLALMIAGGVCIITGRKKSKHYGS